ncbi:MULTISPECIES: hypothetical protein [Rhodococcus]|jgi:hypothetical protein|uniref:hypothetical protein n=1 Tax=Rhodococcus TaxID=1827 RepID=UPI0006426600|nr:MULTISPECIES: hypothetical protein [Rhodococcus]NHP18519.1 hypothetical protein [Rhodococcus sp. IC4_135]KLN71646.1 hypothetical protein ABM90_10860 [Rhodococcus erythropolis]KSU66269.1 hypothetical protein AS032_32140 [Rhodococcus qingshengii]MBP2520968.1 hypothetical protein [Rhodococcus sp. PvP104]MBY6382563.1 hypothetical protein [Rhodococcus erythropolis]
MAVRIERAVILDPEHIKAIQTTFKNEGPGDPVVRAYREALRATAPSWLPSVKEDTNTVSRGRLGELLDALASRRDLVDSIPDGDAKTKAFSELDKLHDEITDMVTQLDANTGAGGQ